jgi:hypothetical protein
MNGDDIVHPTRKLMDTCNRLVAGSNPAAGAEKFSEKLPLGSFSFSQFLRESGAFVQDSKTLSKSHTAKRVRYERCTVPVGKESINNAEKFRENRHKAVFLISKPD